MRFPMRYARIAKGVSAVVFSGALPEIAVVNRIALALALAGHARSMWIKEMQREEEARNSVSSDGNGSGTASNVGTQASLIRLLVGLLPEWARFGLWGALHERYSTPPATDSTDKNSNVPIAPI